jgi:hypothetical protein
MINSITGYFACKTKQFLYRMAITGGNALKLPEYKEKSLPMMRSFNLRYLPEGILRIIVIFV